MHFYYLKIFIIVFFSFFWRFANAEMTIEEFVFDESMPLHLKILEVLPEEAIIQIGDNNSENTIIEFLDYFCGYCKKLHFELIELVNEREDVRVVFIQHPILNESSHIISKMVLAANLQGKGIDLHNAIFSIEGSLNHNKLEKAIKTSGVDEFKLSIDIGKIQINNLLDLSSFVAGGLGARGTPSIFVNESFSPGYLPKNSIIELLK